jgi:hypothetical protein
VADKNILEIAEDRNDQGNANFAVYQGNYPHPKPDAGGIPVIKLSAPDEGSWAKGGNMIQEAGIDFPSVARPLLLSPQHRIQDSNTYDPGIATMPKRLIVYPDSFADDAIK